MPDSSSQSTRDLKSFPARFSARFIDAHCHLADHRLFKRIDAMLAAARDQQIGAFIQGGIHPADWDLQLELAERYPSVVYPCFGIHPWFVAGRMGVTGLELKKQVDHALEILPEYFSRKPGAVGIGELGIDLGPKTDPSTEAFQTEVFVRQLEIAQKANLPLVLHIVKAHPQAIALLAKHGPWPRGGIVHAFSGSYEIAREYERLGLTPSIGGVAAKKGYETLKRALKRLPLESIVVESDSPDQIPDEYHGFEEGTNDPRSLWTVAEAICKQKNEPGLTPEKVLEASRLNLFRIFGLELRVISL
jgi:TatD DNase family protein